MQKRRRVKVNSKIKLSKTARNVLIMLAISILAIGTAAFFKSFSSKTEIISRNRDIYKYTNKYNSNANINLVDNEYVQEDEIIEGQTYLSDLISDIDMKLKYEYKASEKTKITYNYRIEADVNAVYKNNTASYDVLNKNEVLMQTENKTINSDDLVIDENIKVDYAKYHKIIKNFKQTMGINAESYLNVKLIVNTIANVNNEDVQNEYVSNYKITLGDKIALVEEKNKDENTKTIRSGEQTTEKTHIRVENIVISSIITIFGYSLLRIILNRTEELKTIRNEFKLELNRILKSCESKLVQIEDLKHVDIENSTKVKDIYQLLKLSEEALVPIYCYIKDEPEEEAYFIVTKYEKTYSYVLR